MQNKHRDKVVVVLDILGGWSRVDSDSDCGLGHNEPETLVGHLDGNS